MFVETTQWKRFVCDFNEVLERWSCRRWNNCLSYFTGWLIALQNVCGFSKDNYKSFMPPQSFIKIDWWILIRLNWYYILIVWSVMFTLMQIAILIVMNKSWLFSNRSCQNIPKLQQMLLRTTQFFLRLVIFFQIKGQTKIKVAFKAKFQLGSNVTRLLVSIDVK